MMYGRGYYGLGNCGFLGPLLMIGVVLLIAILVYFLLKSNKSKSNEAKPSEAKPNEAKPVESKFDDSYALAILKEKFAKGEITEEEYLNKKNVLERR